MRKPRDYAADLKALNDKARQLQERKVRELGQLVIATGAEALSIEHLAGALLAAATSTDFVMKEEWRERGAGFFQSGRRRHGGSDDKDTGSTAPNNGSTAPPGSGARAS